MKGIWTEKDEKQTRASIRRHIFQEFSAAERALKPPIRAMWEGVYENFTEEAEAQMSDLRRFIEQYSHEYDTSIHEGGVEGLK
jgi:2-oxoisovalerate dehydrogenase E1 component alpha subunit